jgi:carboxypeptidase A1
MLLSTFLTFIGISLAYGNYDGQEIWSCKVPNQDVSYKLHKYDVFGHRQEEITLRLRNEKEKNEVQNTANCKVVVKDLNKYMTRYGSNSTSVMSRRSVPNPLPDDEFFKDYRSFDQIMIQYKYWADKYPKYVKFIDSIGKSVEGRDIFAIEITAPSPYGKAKKNIMYTGGQHAREWISPATVAYIVYNMLKDAESDAQVGNHLQEFVYRIVPVVNPDGYEYTRSTDRFWRKNRRNNGDGTFGVDLNRNWDYKWGYVGSDTDTDSEVYQGPSAGSEPEVQATAAYMKSVSKAYGAIDWHSYSQVAGWSWGWTYTPSSNNAILKSMGDSVVKAINQHGYKFVSAQSSKLGVASGAADDYMAVNLEAVSMTMELCPSGSSSVGFTLPPSQIIPCASAVYDGHKEFAEFLVKNPNIPPIVDIP